VEEVVGRARQGSAGAAHARDPLLLVGHERAGGERDAEGGVLLAS